MQEFTPPTTVDDWRRRADELLVVSSQRKPRDVWDPLEAMLAAQGYLLWRRYPDDSSFLVWPPNQHARCPDGFSFRTQFDDMIREDQRRRNSFDVVVSQAVVCGYSA